MIKKFFVICAILACAGGIVAQNVSIETNKNLNKTSSINTSRAETLAIDTIAAKPVADGEPVVINGKELFKIYSSLGPLSPRERAEGVVKRLNGLLERKTFNRENLKIVKSEITTDILYEDSIIMSITPEDAEKEAKSADELASIYAEKIAGILINKPQHIIVNSPDDIYTFAVAHKDVIVKSAVALFSVVVFFIVLYYITKLFNKLYALIEQKKGIIFKGIIIKGYEIVSDSTLVSFVILFLKAIKLSMIIGFLYALISVLFLLFPWAKSSAIMSILKGILLTILTLVIGFGIFKGLKVLMQTLQDNVTNLKGIIIKPLKIKTVTIITEEQGVAIIKKLIFGMYVLLNLLLLYIIIPIVFSYFEFTKTWADALFGYILNPLKVVITSFINFLPNMFFIIVIFAVNYYVIKFAKLIFDEIRDGNIVIPNFERDWADPTYKIVRSLIIVFTIIVVFPYLPGSQSEAFKGVSIFLGILFSLGSTSVVANIVAGAVLIYMNAFKIGDRVKIGDTIGDVVEKTLLITRIKTIKNVVITIPNSIVMGSHIINYTTSAVQGKGLILHTTITLGYDVPWRKIHETLISAALSTENVLKEPAPFVLQTSLDDFYVSYELNCYTDRPEIMARIYSQLHQNIQDKCNEAGIEILSPHYAAVRDGNASTIPANYLPKTYTAPPFVLKIIEKLSKGSGS